MANYGETSQEHFEVKFEFPLWKIIKEYANKNDCSYVDASEAVLSDYVATIRYDDEAFEDECMKKRHLELETVGKEDEERFGTEKKHAVLR